MVSPGGTAVTRTPPGPPHALVAQCGSSTRLVIGRYGSSNLPGGALESYGVFGTLRGRSQYGDLQRGQTLGFRVLLRGTHWCPQRVHFQPGRVTWVMPGSMSSWVSEVKVYIPPGY